MRRHATAALLGLLVAGCAATLRSPPGPLAGSDHRTVPELAAAIAETARRSDHAADATLRAQLAAQAARDAEACLRLAPQAVPCLYEQAIALGLQARAHPIQADSLLARMLTSLASAEAADANYDEAGPARVKALVLIRAPGWPLGPGDLDAGLLAARRAVAARPLYPPNQLALAEALAKSGDAAGSRDLYQQARTLAQSLPASADRDDWLRQAEQGLQRP